MNPPREVKHRLSNKGSHKSKNTEAEPVNISCDEAVLINNPINPVSRFTGRGMLSFNI